MLKRTCYKTYYFLVYDKILLHGIFRFFILIFFRIKRNVMSESEKALENPAIDSAEATVIDPTSSSSASLPQGTAQPTTTVSISPAPSSGAGSTSGGGNTIGGGLAYTPGQLDRLSTKHSIWLFLIQLLGIISILYFRNNNEKIILSIVITSSLCQIVLDFVPSSVKSRKLLSALCRIAPIIVGVGVLLTHQNPS